MGVMNCWLSCKGNVNNDGQAPHVPQCKRMQCLPLQRHRQLVPKRTAVKAMARVHLRVKVKQATMVTMVPILRMTAKVATAAFVKVAVAATVRAVCLGEPARKQATGLTVVLQEGEKEEEQEQEVTKEESLQAQTVSPL